jgi:FAD binding domain-containing protein
MVARKMDRVATSGRDRHRLPEIAWEVGTPAAGRAPPMASPGDAIQRDKDLSWKNYGQNVQLTVGTYYLLSNGASGAAGHGLRAIQTVVNEVEAARGSVSPVGSRWSFSRTAVNPAAMVDLTRMGLQMPFTADQIIVPPSEVLHVQAGTTIETVMRYVEGSGRELLGMGGNCGQTIGGVIATGSHGGFPRGPGFPDMCRALYLVAEHGTLYWLERASRCLISDAFARTLQGAGVRVIREDALFEDTVVGLGAFGIVHSVVLDTAPAYFVALDRQQRDLDDELRAAFFQHDFAQLGRAEPLHFEMVVNPFRCTRGPDGRWRGTNAAIVTTMDQIPVGTPTTDEQPGPTLNAGDLAPLIAGWAHQAPDTLPGIVDLLVPALYPLRKVHGPLSWANPLSTVQAPTLSLELGVSADAAATTFDRICDGLQALGIRLPGLIGIRQTAGSTATLSMARWPLTYTFEFACLGVAGLQDQLIALLDFLEQAGVVFTLNLGQVVGPSSGPPWLSQHGRLDRIYGADSIRRWRRSRARLCPSGATFRNQLTDGLKLT